MRGHILDLSNEALDLHVRNEQLLINKEGVQIYSIPLEDIAVILLAHPGIKSSVHFFQRAIENRCAIVLCDQRFAPIGMTLPISGHHLSAERLDMQIRVDVPTKKRVWRQLVRSKINFQAYVLKTLFGDDEGLRAIAKEVKSGDTDNREGVAAKRYWARLFQGLNFKRDYDGGDPINAALNYGYGIIRAIVARAIVGTGFNPTLGVHHHNRYNAFALADDLMEPLRPVIDICVFRMQEENLLGSELTHDIKTRIVNQVNSHERFLVDGKQERIFETAALLAESLVKVYAGDAKDLRLPDTLPLTEVEFKGSAFKTEPQKPRGRRRTADPPTEERPKPERDPFQDPPRRPRPSATPKPDGAPELPAQSAPTRPEAPRTATQTEETEARALDDSKIDDDATRYSPDDLNIEPQSAEDELFEVDDDYEKTEYEEEEGELSLEFQYDNWNEEDELALLPEDDLWSGEDEDDALALPPEDEDE